MEICYMDYIKIIIKVCIKMKHYQTIQYSILKKRKKLSKVYFFTDAANACRSTHTLIYIYIAVACINLCTTTVKFLQ